MMDSYILTATKIFRTHTRTGARAAAYISPSISLTRETRRRGVVGVKVNLPIIIYVRPPPSLSQIIERIISISRLVRSETSVQNPYR